MITKRLQRFINRGGELPFDMFDAEYTHEQARRARRLENIYHVGQDRIWDGREVLAELIAKHGKPRLGPKETKALGRIFAIIMWGELAAWKISAQLADRLEKLEPRLAAASQVHDEARHFYVMHDYLEALGYMPKTLDFWSRRVVEMTLGVDDLTKKLFGMQLTIEVIALTLFQRVRELDVEPVLSELLPYYERDEARHVGLGTQIVPELIAKMSPRAKADFGVFQLDLLTSTLMGLKGMEPDLMSIGVDPRSILGVGFRKITEINKAMRDEFPDFPEDPPVTRMFHGMCELLFPQGGHSSEIPLRTRVSHAIDVTARKREGVIEIWSKKSKHTGASPVHA